eukprot:GFUD01002488.1.p1 GENE.GFUD01002488.1~~GFUD01002488.1.p1  ORF type:complete len:490 (-),score=98.30 GFUD01002488.1:2003-3436(-)
MLTQTQGFINGEWRDSLSGDTFEVRNPFNDELVETIADCGIEDAELAIDEASKAFKVWRKTTPKVRSGYLRKIGDLLLENQKELAALMTKEQGKPLGEAAGEVGFSAAFFHFFSEECKRPDGEMIPSPVAGKQFITVREPLGVAAMVCPWNFPIGMPARKVAAAMAAGCTCVVKPAEDTPLISLAFAKIIQMAEVPAGVVNVIPCSRNKVQQVGSLFCESPKVAVVSFTGSTEVGQHLYSLCGKSVKRVALELGGNAPFIVFKSADLDLAVQGLMAAKFRNSGQTCVTANRIMVHKDLYEEFLEKFKATCGTLKVGNGAESGTTQGPIINAKQLNRVVRIVEDSLKQGAKLEMGGKTEGCCYLPTVLTNVTPDMACWKEEIFGPVAAIGSFDDEEEAVTEANNSDRGLAGYFFSRDYSQIWRVARELEMGMVGINDVGISNPETPFGGYKTSGIGKEGSKHGLDEYSNLKLIDMGGL